MITDRLKLTFIDNSLSLHGLEYNDGVDVEDILIDLGDVDIVTCNELDNGSQNQWLLASNGWIYELTENIIGQLLKNQSILIDPSFSLTDKINTTDKNDLEYLEWYFNKGDNDENVAEMYNMCGWVVTDIDNHQAYKKVNDDVYIFRENRLVEPNVINMVELEINLKEYKWRQVIEACSSFGYKVKDIRNWLETGDKSMIAECLFETS